MSIDLAGLPIGVIVIAASVPIIYRRITKNLWNRVDRISKEDLTTEQAQAKIGKTVEYLTFYELPSVLVVYPNYKNMLAQLDNPQYTRCECGLPI